MPHQASLQCTTVPSAEFVTTMGRLEPSTKAFVRSRRLGSGFSRQSTKTLTIFDWTLPMTLRGFERTRKTISRRTDASYRLVTQNFGAA